MITTIILVILLAISLFFNWEFKSEIGKLNSKIDGLSSSGLFSEGLPQDIVTKSKAFELIEAHQNKELPKFSNSVFVPWNDFLAYLNFARLGMSKVGKKITGLEFYFAANGDSEYNSTLVVYPTYFDKSKEEKPAREDGHIPFDFIHNGDVSELYNNRNINNKNVGVSTLKVDSKLSAAYNKMGQSPPRMPQTL